MHRRGLPIAWIGLIIVLVAFVVWYGWQTNIAPMLAEQHAQHQHSEPQAAVPTPTEAEVKAQLERNRASVSAQAATNTTPKQEEKSKQTPSQMPKPDPKRDVVEYWWEQTPVKTKK
jgi:sRNA-binding protein